MRMGTKSLLFGAHAFWLHPILVWIGWVKTFGFRRVYYRPLVASRAISVHAMHPMLWVACIVHDWGYFGKPNMDGPEGQEHPQLGMNIVYRLCKMLRMRSKSTWAVFTGAHSGSFCKRRLNNIPTSPLYYPDKLALVYHPAILYVLGCWWSGELDEYVVTYDRGVRGELSFRAAMRWITNARFYILNSDSRNAFRSRYNT